MAAPARRTRSRPLAATAVAAVLLFLLSGCVKLNADFQVDAEENLTGAMEILVDPVALEDMGSPDPSQELDDAVQEAQSDPEVPEGATVERVDDEDGYIGMRVTFDAVPASEFQSGGGGLGDVGVEGIQVESADGEITFSMTNPLIAGMDSADPYGSTSGMPSARSMFDEAVVAVTFPRQCGHRGRRGGRREHSDVEPPRVRRRHPQRHGRCVGLPLGRSPHRRGCAGRPAHRSGHHRPGRRAPQEEGGPGRWIAADDVCGCCRCTGRHGTGAVAVSRGPSARSASRWSAAGSAWPAGALWPARSAGATEPLRPAGSTGAARPAIGRGPLPAATGRTERWRRRSSIRAAEAVGAATGPRAESSAGCEPAAGPAACPAAGPGPSAGAESAAEPAARPTPAQLSDVQAGACMTEAYDRA